MTDMAPLPFEAGLLPSSATPYMLALEEASRLPEELWRALAKVADVKRDLPDEAIPFLIWEHGLEEVVPWVPDLRQVLRDGRVWQRLRGTPSSIAMALSWIETHADAIEEETEGTWWDLFQLRCARPLPAAMREATTALVRLSKPTHMDCVRLYSPQYDLRPLGINGAGRINGAGLVNDWSGIWLDPKKPKASFGRYDGDRLAIALPALETQSRTESYSAGRLSRVFGFRLNADLIDGPQTMEPWFAKGGTTAERIGQTDMLDSDWPLGGWPEGIWPTTPWGQGLAFSTRSQIIAETQE